jgi:hypothetical protein
MKSVAYLLLLFAVLGCKKEKSNKQPDKQSEIRAKLQGKWQLTRQEDEIWQPVDVLVVKEDNPVSAGDSAIFTNTEIYAYTDTPNGVDEEVYPLVFANDSTLLIDDEPFIIQKLTDKELILYYVELDLTDNRKDVTRNTLTR